MQALVRELNRLYRGEAALHQRDDRAEGFQWLIGDDQRNSVFAWLRHADGAAPLLVVHNFTPEPRPGYRIGVPRAGAWEVLLNTDDERFTGSNAGSMGSLASEAVAAHGEAQSVSLDLPPLGTLVLRPEGTSP
ncbi:1,4-alpha-glucan branching enzyme GlgB [compost metagenome]